MIIDTTSKFVYVMGRSACDELLAKGYRLLKSDDKNGVYTFENNKKLTFELAQVRAAASNTLTF